MGRAIRLRERHARPPESLAQVLSRRGSALWRGLPPPSFSQALSRARPAAAAALTLLAAPALAQDAPRLLTGLSAEVGPGGVALSWTVDESRAHRITGFTCVYLTPGHIKTGVAGGVPCEPVRSPADARGRTVAGLPEYGDYDFELVVLETKDGPGIPWPRRALRLRVAVTGDLAGPAGPERAVTGAGPLVEACRPDDAAPRPPWRLDDIVSAAHLTHYPGNGWTPGGDPAIAPDWPEPRPAAELMAEAGVDAEPLRRALSGAGVDRKALARMLAGERTRGAISAAGAGTRALLRPGPAGGWDLRLHSSYPFGDDYVFGAAHAVPGWADPAHPAAWPALWNRADCPPADRPGATHDVALVLSGDIGGGRKLAHAGYGWWAVAPVGLFPERVVATKGGLSWGAPASRPPADGTRYTGRASGHLFWDKRRWALAGDVELELGPGSGGPQLAGRIFNIVIAPLDPETLVPAGGAPVRLPELRLEAGGAASDGAWSGAAGIGEASGEALAGFPASAAFEGDWRAAAHGPEAGEAAGRLRLWTSLPDGADRATEWTRQAVLVAGFGAAGTTGRAQ